MFHENLEAWLVWKDSETQLRAGGMGVIGIDYSEVRQSIRDLGFYRSRGLEQKIKCLERTMLKHVISRDT